MTSEEFKNIERHIGRKVAFRYASLLTGRETRNEGILTGSKGDCVLVANETQDCGSILHYSDVYFI